MYITKATVTRLANYAASSVEHVEIGIEVYHHGNYFYISFFVNDTIGVDINVYSQESNVCAYIESFDEPKPEDIHECKNFKELKEFFEVVKNIIESV